MNPENTDPTNTPPAETPVSETPAPESAPNPTPEFAPNPTPESTAPTPIVEAAPAPGVTPQATPEATTSATAADAAPVTATPVGAPNPKNANTKKIVLIASITAGVLLLAAIAAIIFTMLNTVSKEDYRAAATQFNEVSRANSTLNSEASTLSRQASGSGTEDSFNDSLKETKDAIADIKAKNDELSKLKAVRVGEGAELYKTFNDKLAANLKYSEGLIASVENLRPAMVTCDKVGDATEASARVTALKACSDALGSVNDLPNEAFKTYVGKIKEGYATYATIYEKTAALTNPYGAQYEEYKTLRDDMRDAQTEISDATREFTTALRESDDTYSVRDSANALGEYLVEQQRK